MKAFVLSFFLLISIQLVQIVFGNKSFAQVHLQKQLHIDIEGMVSVDGKPSAAIIEINSTSKHHENIEKIHSNATTGKFHVSLKTGDEYDIVVKVNKLPPQILLINTVRMDTNKTINVYADFTTASYDHRLEELKKNIEKQMANDLKMSSFEKQFGKVKKEKLFYKIQVGAFKFYENFNYTNVIDLPKIIRKIDSDYITRFTIGNYQTYSEAARMLKKIQDCNLKEAFIIAYYNDDRKLLSQLISEKILH